MLTHVVLFGTETYFKSPKYASIKHIKMVDISAMAMVTAALPGNIKRYILKDTYMT